MLRVSWEKNPWNLYKMKFHSFVMCHHYHNKCWRFGLVYWEIMNISLTLSFKDFFMYLLSSPVRGNADHKMETIFRNQMNVFSVPNWHKVEHVQKYFQQQWNTANPDHSLDYLIITVFCEFWHKVISGYLTTSTPHTNTQTVDPALQFIVSFLSQAL